MKISTLRRRFSRNQKSNDTNLFSQPLNSETFMLGSHGNMPGSNSTFMRSTEFNGTDIFDNNILQ